MSDVLGQRRVVIFDMGNVLIDWDPDARYQLNRSGFAGGS